MTDSTEFDGANRDFMRPENEGVTQSTKWHPPNIGGVLAILVAWAFHIVVRVKTKCAG